jgi:hypothetical protein
MVTKFNSAEIQKEVTTQRNKMFFWKDKSGRGFIATLQSEDVLGLENEEDWNGELLHEWVEECEAGDRWENRVSEIICLRD